jgi:AcrR family transcriptional regulator
VVPSTERGTRTRALIVTGAGELFAERGFAATSVGDVVERVGITKGAFYFHFDSKSQLAREVVEGYRNFLRLLQREAAAAEQEPLRRVARVLLPVADSFRTSPISRATTRLLEESNQLELEPAMKVHLPWWHAILEQADARGQLQGIEDVQRFAWIINAAVYGTISNGYATSRWADLPERMADLIRYILLPSLAPKAAAMVAEQLDDPSSAAETYRPPALGTDEPRMRTASA